MSIAHPFRFGNTVLSNGNTARYTLKAILNRGYFWKMRLSSLSFSRLFLREEKTRCTLGTPTTFQRRKGSRRKVSATFHKHEINFNPPRHGRTAIRARARKLCLFINSRSVSCTKIGMSRLVLYSLIWRIYSSLCGKEENQYYTFLLWHTYIISAYLRK